MTLRAGIRPLELRMQRKQTQAFINVDAWDLVLIRKTPAVDGEGGRIMVETQLPIQRVRIIPARSRSTSLTYTLPTGEVISSKDMLMVGAHDLDVQRKDHFTWQGRALQVSYVENDHQFHTLCQLDELGEEADSTV